MRAVALLFLWVWGACLARTNLGAEAVLSDGGDGQQAEPDPERLATDAFGRQMLGRWQGELPLLLPESRVDYEFLPDWKYISIYTISGTNRTFREEGYYFITDRLASGRYRGVLEDAERNPTATLRNMRIQGDILEFVRDGAEGSSVSLELTKAQ